MYRTLDTPIKARYVRFQPKFWKNGICMRVELYGKITTGIDERLSSLAILRIHNFDKDANVDNVAKFAHQKGRRQNMV